MNADEYIRYDALGLAELIRKSEVSAEEVLRAAQARANQINPHINAIVHRFDERADQHLKNTDSNAPFFGVPFLVKDLLDHHEHEPTRMGSKHVHYVSPHDTERVKRFKRAGVSIFGKTATPELGLTITTEPEAFGPTRNPWNLAHSCGGSSGGSAAAVASGIVPMASASDGGGSIRFPAACCGLFGLKPSRGLVPDGPDVGEDWDGASTSHVITRSVRDSANMLDCIIGQEPVAPPFVRYEPKVSFAAALETPLDKPLRIALCDTPFIGERN